MTTGVLASPLVGAGCADEPGDRCTAADTRSGTPLPFEPEGLEEDAALFPLGVQCGAANGTSAVLWCYCADGANKTLRLWRSRAPEATSASAEPDASIATIATHTVTAAPVDGYLKVALEDLTPGERYAYAFFSDETATARRSTIGEFRSGASPGCRAPLTIAATSCTNQRYAPFLALLHMAEQPIDAICHLGDMSYNDGATTRAQYRALWRRTLNDPGYRALLRRAGLYATLDDHEIIDNSALYRIDANHKATALAALRETLALPDLPQGRLWNNYRWGDTAEIFVLDCRTERRPDTRETPEAAYISDAQLTWLEAALRASTSHFKIVLNSVPITRFPSIWPFAEDRWQGYAAQRDKLTSLLVEARLRNVWFLSGDFHISAVVRVEAEGPLAHTWEILCGPGGNRTPLWDLFKDNAEARAIFAPPERFAFVGGEPASTLLTFDPARDAVRIVYREAQSGETVFDRWIAQPAT